MLQLNPCPAEYPYKSCFEKAIDPDKLASDEAI